MNLSKNIFLSIVTLSVMATFCACSDLENTAPEMMVDIYKTQSGKAYAMGGVGSQKFIDSVDAQESYNRLVQSFLENGFVDSCMSCEPSPADNPDLDPLYYFSFVSMKEESGVVHLPVEMISYASLKEFRCSLNLKKNNPNCISLVRLLLRMESSFTSPCTLTILTMRWNLRRIVLSKTALIQNLQ